ncbi:hypothetical protein CRENBAI_010986 [Crenichthys baileyi]|uniref:Uncharacterized protein n=1 Tax=Crenichthys baileyi TaxID=28760 RepID=A0AAV9RMB3_9TELE
MALFCWSLEDRQSWIPPALQPSSTTILTPPRILWASGKRIKNSYTSPAKRRRGRPTSSPAPAAASPGLAAPAISPPIFVPKTDPPAPQVSTSSSTPAIPQSSLLHSSRSWILSSAPTHPLLTCSGSSPPSLSRQISLFPAPLMPPAPRPFPPAFALDSARPSSSLG